MDNTNGFIKLWRDMKRWEWYADVNTKVIFIDILLSAQYSNTSYKGVPVNAGQAVIGLKALADRNGLTIQQVRTALKHLKETGEISTAKVTNKFSVVTVENWAKYQACEMQSNTQSNTPATNEQHASNNIQERKKERKKELLYYGNDDIMSDLFHNADKLPEIMERIGGEE